MSALGSKADIACAPHMSAFGSKADKYERWEVSPLHVGIVIGSDNAIVAPLYFDVARTRGSFDDPRGFRKPQTLTAALARLLGAGDCRRYRARSCRRGVEFPT